MADSNREDLPDGSEKEQEEKDEVSSSGKRSESYDTLREEVNEMKEQLQIHIETIGLLVAEKKELESTVAERQKLIDSKQYAIEELSKALEVFRNCTTDDNGKCACKDNLSSQMVKLREDAEGTDERMRKIQEMQLQNRDALVEEMKLAFQAKEEETSRCRQQLGKQESELDTLKDKTENLTRENAELMEQLEKNKDSAAVAAEALRKENANRWEEMETKTRQLQGSLDEMQKEKEALIGENFHIKELLKEKDTAAERYEEMMAQLRHCMKTQEDAVNELSLSRDRLTREAEQLSLQLTQKDTLAGEQEKQMEQLQFHSKQLHSQVTSLLVEKDRLLSERDELQSILKDLRLRYAVASEELAQDNEATRIVTDSYNKLEAQLDQANKVIEVQSAENQELSRRLEEKTESLRKLEAAMETLKSGRLEYGKPVLNGEKEEQETVTGKSDSFDRYSNELMEHLRQNAPLIERLQKELSSAQDTINALTNQNSDLKSQMKSNLHHDSNEMNTLQSLNKKVREKEFLEKELEELSQQHHTLQERMELIQEDLAQQVPASINGDIVTRAHFEALQSVMKRLEAKYTKVMRDKADLLDTTERLEHIITQLQDESNTIGEYVSLYHHQRFVLRQRTAEKDGYIYQLANERMALQNQLSQLQGLIIQLLNERKVLDSSNSNDSAASSQASKFPWVADIEGAVDEELNHSPGELNGEKCPHHDHCAESGDIGNHESTHSGSALDQVNIPSNEQTARKIMNLLNKIGTSKLVDGRPFEERSYVRCGHCSGQILYA